MNQTTMPLVSVIVRTKDRPHMLEQALQSIAQQTYPFIEIVVVNDGGCDVNGVTAVVERCVSALKLEQLPKSVGRTAAANRGLELASGDYICFLDDDDYWLPNHLEGLVSLLEEESATVVYSGTKVVKVCTDKEQHDISEYNVDYDPLRLDYENFLPIHSVLFSRKYIDQGIRFDENFDLFEDWDFWLQLSQKVEFIHHPKLTAVYCLHKDASGVHQYEKIKEAYFSIYSKWLTQNSLEKIYTLLRQSHQWHDSDVEVLQQRNQARSQVELNVIGDKHTQALNIIKERETQLHQVQHQLEQLGEEHAYAQVVVQERDQQLTSVQRQLEQLGKEYTHAQNVVKERDAQLKELDGVLSALREEYLAVQQEMKNKDKRIEKYVMELRKIKSSKLWSLCRRLLK